MWLGLGKRETTNPQSPLIYEQYSSSTSVHLFPAPRSTSKRHSFEVSFKPEEVV